ncbi:hypothetical protein STANM309S_02690 [Streptomyces tanashiensis]
MALANGEWHGDFLEPAPADNPACALSVVTDAAQETVTEHLCRHGRCAGSTISACIRARWTARLS